MKKTIALFIFIFIIKYSFAQTDSGYFSSFDKTKIYYEVHGDGFPVLLVHGFIVNSNSWKRTSLYDTLLNAGYKVILVDLRGNGKSDKPHNDRAYANDAEAKDIMLLLKHLNIKNYYAVGYSRGSIITARLLVLDKNLQRAALGGMGADFTNPNWQRRIDFYHALSADTVPALHTMVQNVQIQSLDQQALALLQKYQPSTPKEVLSKIKTPVLVIHGTADIDNGSADELASLFPNAEKALCAGDHNHASATPEFASAVLNFLKQPESELINIHLR